MGLISRLAGGLFRASPIGQAFGVGQTIGNALIPTRQGSGPGTALARPHPTGAIARGPHGRNRVGVSPLGTVGFKHLKSRRMNAGNAKALRRALRRVKSFTKLARKSMAAMGYHSHRGPCHTHHHARRSAR